MAPVARSLPSPHFGAGLFLYSPIRNLTLSAPHLNRNLKVAKDAADWRPDENRCWFAWRVIDVRRAYDLTIDRREADALDAILETCPESSPDTLPACPDLPKENKP